MSSNMSVPKICQHCGKEFIARTTVTQFCGDACAKRNYKKRKREEKINKVVPAAKQKLDYNQNILRDKDFLNIAQACELLGASRMTIYRQIKKGRISAAKLGRRTIIRRTDIDNLFVS